MCGIVSYVGHREAVPIVIEGLKRLEYRGYDSAGIAVINNSKLNIFKRKGKVVDLTNTLSETNTSGNIAIGHTRWATHGEPNDVNAHPHYSSDKKIALVHNGIIENYLTLKKELIRNGHVFESETDTEVLIHFIEEVRKNYDAPLEEIVRLAFNRIVGAYGVVIISEDEPDTMISIRKSSPLIIGIGEGEFFIASDASPIIEYTKKVVYLDDNQMAIIRNGSLEIKDMHNVKQTPYVQTLDIELETIEKGGYPHFMLKEIFEQPKTISDCMRGRLSISNGHLTLGGIQKYADNLYNAKRIILIACGTSYYASMIAEYIIEDLCRIPVEVEYASEFRYRNPVINEGDAVIAVSQSGETADTLVALEMAKKQGAIVFGVCNVVGSSIARATHEGVYTHAGPEIGVASTKAFTAQLIVLTTIALKIAIGRNSVSKTRYEAIINEMKTIPAKVKETLELNDEIKKLADKFMYPPNFLYLGRGYNYPVAMEGALKLKEISYIHAEGYPAAEMKHGPIALIDEMMPVVVIATKDRGYEKIVSNIQEVKSRKGVVIAIVTKGDELIQSMADHVIEIPQTDEILTPLFSVIPLQLFAYHIGINRGCNVDQPRNLAKSVTVE